MIVASLCLCLLAAPQEPAKPPSPGTVHTDPNGWPVVPAEGGPVPASAGIGTRTGDPAHGEVVFDTPSPPAAVTGTASATPPTPTPAAAARGAAPLGSGRLDSPLRDVWNAVGQPAVFAAERGAHAQIKLHLFDASGQEVSTRVMFHEADLRAPERDRIEFAAGRKVYGRDGAAVWALIDNVIWQSREQEARDLLRVFGFLLRAPWVFAEPGYVAWPAEVIQVNGESRVRIRVDRTPEIDGGRFGPEPTDLTGDRFELICRPDTMLPEELRYRLAEGAEERRVQLLQYQALPSGLWVPLRRVFVGHDGRRLMELELVVMRCGVDIPSDEFRPPVR